MQHPTLFDLVCQNCGSTDFLEILEPPNSIHHARRNCKNCGRYQGWVKKPRQEISICKLLQNSGLQTWEKSFLKILSTKRTWMRNEQGLLGEISDRLNQF